MAKFIIKIIATGCFLGYIPKGCGTVASLLSLVIYLLLPTSRWLYLSIIFVALILSIVIASIAEKIFGIKDDKRIVIDEIVGLWVALLLVPKKLIFIIMGFVIYRFFDVVKLPRIRNLQKLPSGIGIVADDLFAGIFTNIILQLAQL